MSSCRGNAEMLLFLLNDERNEIVGHGISIINQRAANMMEQMGEGGHGE
jgi:hypothetical protein